MQSKDIKEDSTLSENAQNIKNKLIGKSLRVVTKNGRIFVGKLMAIDFRGNIILHETVAEIVEQHSCPLNLNIQNLLDSKLQFPGASQQLSEQEEQKQKQRYYGTHYYFGAVMISGYDIAKAEMSIQTSNHKESETNTQHQDNA